MDVEIDRMNDLQEASATAVALADAIDTLYIGKDYKALDFDERESFTALFYLLVDSVHKVKRLAYDDEPNLREDV